MRIRSEGVTNLHRGFLRWGLNGLPKAVLQQCSCCNLKFLRYPIGPSRSDSSRLGRYRLDSLDIRTNPGHNHLIYSSIQETNLKLCNLVAVMSKELPLSHYEILGLSSPNGTDSKISLLDIKSAYRRALLRHHPDKSGSIFGTTANAACSKYSVDQLLLAYKTLIDPASRLQYDQSLKTASVGTTYVEISHPGLESVDLDDLEFDEAQATWYRGCRCGNERGFVISEGELEEDAEIGEVVTGCRGCSLWLRVTFAVADDG